MSADCPDCYPEPDQDAKAARIESIRATVAEFAEYRPNHTIAFLLAEYDSMAAENAALRPIVKCAVEWITADDPATSSSRYYELVGLTEHYAAGGAS